MTARKTKTKAKRVRAKSTVTKSARYSKRMCDQAQRLAKLGATDEEIAEFLKVNIRQFYRYRNAYPEFAAALAVGKDEADNRVERRLYERCLGFEVKREKVFVHDGEVIRTTIKEEVLPDTTAMIFWLKNRRPDEWRETRHLVGGNSGNTTNVQVSARVTIEARLGAMSKVIHGDNPPTLDLTAEEVKTAIEGLIDGRKSDG